MRTRSLLFALLALVLGACSRHPAPSPPPDAQAVLYVENHHWLDVDIYLLHSSNHRRLGMVTATSNASFIVPRSMLDLGDVRFAAHPVGGGRTLTSEAVYVRPGSEIHWTLENALQRSSLSIY
jgi:hypothetical protein